MYKTEFSIVWKIEDFSFCNEKTDQYFNSPDYNIPSLTDRTWGLRLYPRGKTEETTNFISCFLYIRGWDSFPAFDVEIKILGPTGEVLKTLKLCDNKSSNKEHKWGSATFLPAMAVTQDARNSTEDSLTICCKVHGKNPTADVFDERIAHTKIGVDRQLIKCHSRYSEGRMVFRTHSEYFKNKYFKFSIASKHNNLIVSMWKPRNRFYWFVVTCKITMLNMKNYETCSETYRHFFEEKECTITIPLAIFLNELKRNAVEYQHSMIKTVYLTAEFSYSNGIYTHFIPNNKSFRTKIPSIKDDLRALFYNKKFCDVKLRVDNQVIEAHKNVLAARSPVFAVMFDHGMTETQMGIVDFVDTDIHILNLFLQFLYTDTVDEMDYEVAMNLLMVAEKYQVLSLKEKCCMFLKTEMSIENVCDILSLANAVNYEYLKSASVDFIIGIPGNVLQSPKWETWKKNNKELARAISFQLYLNASSRKANMCDVTQRNLEALSRYSWKV
ncbi:uncharacterized protein [Parasteatoda tepidariorum]|uniref:uncharacterized protein isoform X1 n=1 Tax=Parasteatoda tepidariorum TaxID=114398 RepID=UPI0039BD2501